MNTKVYLSKEANLKMKGDKCVRRMNLVAAVLEVESPSNKKVANELRVLGSKLNAVLPNFDEPQEYR